MFSHVLSVTPLFAEALSPEFYAAAFVVVFLLALVVGTIRPDD